VGTHDTGGGAWRTVHGPSGPGSNDTPTQPAGYTRTNLQAGQEGKAQVVAPVNAQHRQQAGGHALAKHAQQHAPAHRTPHTVHTCTPIKRAHRSHSDCTHGKTSSTEPHAPGCSARGGASPPPPG
jgi:hypothetical protein